MLKMPASLRTALMFAVAVIALACPQPPASTVDAGPDAGALQTDASACGSLPSTCALDCAAFPSDCYAHWQQEPACGPLCEAAQCCTCAGSWQHVTVDCALPGDAGFDGGIPPDGGPPPDAGTDAGLDAGADAGPSCADLLSSFQLLATATQACSMDSDCVVGNYDCALVGLCSEIVNQTINTQLSRLATEMEAMQCMNALGDCRCAAPPSSAVCAFGFCAASLPDAGPMMDAGSADCTLFLNTVNCSPAPPGDLSECNSVLATESANCVSAGCSWSGATTCTVGGSTSSAVCYGGMGGCSAP
jgi:hypothetical protein